MTASTPQPVKLLWTGGWDSTFRLLQLVLIDRVPVQPYYMIDVDRRSTGTELYTMRNIRQQVYEQHPHTRELILPTIFYDVFDIPPFPYLTEQWNHLNSQYHVGTQHEWLVRYCEHFDIWDVEISLETPGYPVEPILPMMVEDEGDTASSRIDPKYLGTPEYAVWGRFRFPIIHYTKHDIERAAREAGFYDVLEMTWFCHNPQPNHQPCGVCGPCGVIMHRRLTHRMPLHGKLRYYRKKGFEQLKNPVGLYYNARGALRNWIRKHHRLDAFTRQMRRNKQPL